MAELSTDRVDQAIHGYRHGHELLRASTSFDDRAASVLSQNSDSAPNARPSDGAYLTGYPLGDGRYVIAKTWHDTAAERPNTVVSHSLILPSSTPPRFSVAQLLARLEQIPEDPAFGDPLKPIPLEDLIGAPLRLTNEEATTAVGFYSSPHPLSFPTSGGRQRIAVALWGQLWRSARNGLSFCTAPDTDRFARVPRSLRFSADETFRTEPLNDAAARMIVDDLESPGPFSEFVQFVGSGERSVGLMQPFAFAFALLSQPHGSVDAFKNLLDEFKGSDPRRLRRLKRRIFGFQRGTPNWRVDPFDALEALGSDRLGDDVYAADASLDRWVRLCWDVDPVRTAESLSATIDGEGEPPAGPLTAREGIASAFATQAPQLVTPATLAVAAALNPSAALDAVWTQNEPALWRAWSELDPPLEVPGENRTEDFDWETALVAVRESASGVSRILRRHPEALDALITLADGAPAPSDLELDLTWDGKRYLRDFLEVSDTRLAGAARLADPRNLPRALDVGAWKRVLRDCGDEVVNAIGYRIGRSAGSDAWEVATLAAADLYGTLAGSDGLEAWKRLEGVVRGDRGSWDRCARLVEDFVHILRGYPETTQAESVKLLQRQSPEAARDVERRLLVESKRTRPKKFRFYDPTTW